MQDMQDFHHIPTALDLPADAAVLDCVAAINVLKIRADPGRNLIRSILNDEEPGISWDPAKERITYQLDEPMKSGTVEIKEIHLRRVKAGDLRTDKDIDRGDLVGHAIAVISRISGQDFKFLVKHLSHEDFKRLDGIVLPFLSAPRRAIQSG